MGWTGAVVQVKLTSRPNNGPMDQQTDGPTDQETDKPMDRYSDLYCVKKWIFSYIVSEKNNIKAISYLNCIKRFTKHVKI